MIFTSYFVYLAEKGVPAHLYDRACMANKYAAAVNTNDNTNDDTNATRIPAPFDTYADALWWGVVSNRTEWPRKGPER